MNPTNSTVCLHQSRRRRHCCCIQREQERTVVSMMSPSLGVFGFNWHCFIGLVWLQAAMGAKNTEIQTCSRGRHIVLASIHEMSHIKPMTSIGRELIERGHQVTFVAPDSCLVGLNDTECVVTTRAWLSAQLPKAKFVAAGSPPAFAEQEMRVLAEAAKQQRRWVPVTSILHVMSELNEPMLPTLLKAFPQNAAKPDLMVVDTLTTAAVDAAEKLGVPVILNNPLPMWHDLAEPQGFVVPIHAYARPTSSLLTFTGRVGNFIEHLSWMAMGVYLGMLRNKMRQKHTELPALPLLPQLSLKGSDTEARAWILQNTVFGLDVPRVVEPRVHLVGPLAVPDYDGCLGRASDCRSTAKWLEKRKPKDKNILYINLGAASAPPLGLAQNVLKAITVVDALTVLWVLDDRTRKQLGSIPGHVKIVRAAPELTVLAHSKVIAMVSTCSIDSMCDALWHGVPVIGLPMRGNQPGICTMAQNAGAARCCRLSSKGWVHPGPILAAIKEVALNESAAADFGERARRLGVLMKAAGGAKRAVDAIELAMEVGLEHLEEPKVGLGLGWLTGSMADVRLGIFALGLGLYTVFRLLCRVCKRWYRWLVKGPRNVAYESGQGAVMNGGGRSDGHTSTR